jgi:LmbE family N-acetylglucosaminyl deacetylase
MAATTLPAGVEPPERLLVVTAHPEDADVCVAGSVASWVSQGTVAYLVCATSGESATDDPAADPLLVAAMREAEARAAADVVGYEGVTFLHRPDGAVAADLALREQLVRVVRRFRPDAVATFDPRPLLTAAGGIVHPDRRQTASAVLAAIHPGTSGPASFPSLARSEDLLPHRVDRLLLFESEQADAWIDIEATLATKVEAVQAHASQLRRRPDLADQVRERAREVGAAVGLPAAEAWLDTAVSGGR